MTASLHSRLLAARASLAPVEPRFCIVWEDPEDPEVPCKVTTPDGRWLAAALAGGILPPVEVYRLLQSDAEGRVTNGHILHETPPCGPMTEEEAMEYLLQKDVPERVWAAAGNRRRFAITFRSAIPADRTFRNSWRLAAFTGQDAA